MTDVSWTETTPPVPPVSLVDTAENWPPVKTVSEELQVADTTPASAVPVFEVPGFVVSTEAAPVFHEDASEVTVPMRHESHGRADVHPSAVAARMANGWVKV